MKTTTMSSPMKLAGAMVAIAAIMLLSAGTVSAATRYKSSAQHFQADGRLVDVQVRIDNGTAPLYFRPGVNDRHYFQALEGRNYSLVVRNNTGRRVAVLIAVDGLNVVNGERSKLSRHEPMYVLGPWEEATIQGWRTSLKDVRRFVFVNEERSYAERTGQANGDMGWIRVLSFNEVRPLYSWQPPIEKQRGAYGDRDDGARRNGAPAPSTEMAPEAPRAKAGDRQTLESEGRALAGRESNPGTGWGNRRYDPVQRTVFHPAARATDRIVLRYEYARGLQALGIFPLRSRTWERERGQLGFARPPRG